MTWALNAAWEIFALCFAVWIAVKHFHEVQRPSTGWSVGDCFTVLVKTHVFYFASVVVPALQLSNFSPKLLYSNSVAEGTFFNLLGPCRCLFWDHGSSLQFENIMLTSSPSPTEVLA